MLNINDSKEFAENKDRLFTLLCTLKELSKISSDPKHVPSFIDLWVHYSQHICNFVSPDIFFAELSKEEHLELSELPPSKRSEAQVLKQEDKSIKTFLSLISELNEPMLLSFILTAQISYAEKVFAKEAAQKMSKERVPGMSRLGLSDNQSFEVYQDLLLLLEELLKDSNYQDDKKIKEIYEIYIKSKFPHLQDQLKENGILVYSNFPNRQLINTFTYAKKVIYPNLKRESDPSLNGNDNDITCVLLKNTHCVAALLFEYIGGVLEQCHPTKPRLYQVHNEIIRIILLLRETRFPGFTFGSPLSLMNMLVTPRALLSAAYLALKIFEHKKLSMNMEAIESDMDSLESELLALVMELQNCEDNKQIIDKLRALKEQYRFTDKQIQEWMLGIKRIQRSYDCYKPELGKRDENSPNPRLLIVGDSVTMGVGLPDAHHQKRCIPLMMSILESKGIRSEIFNYSIMGFQTEDGLILIKELLDTYVPDVVLCTLGGNDILKANWSLELQDKIEENMVKFVEVCKEKGIRHVGWGLEIPATFHDYEKWQAAFSEIAKRVSERTGIPVFTVPGGMLKEEHIGLDTVHANELGHRIIAENFVDIVKGTLQNEWTEDGILLPSPHKPEESTPSILFLKEAILQARKSLEQNIASLAQSAEFLEQSAIKQSAQSSNDTSIINLKPKVISHV